MWVVVYLTSVKEEAERVHASLIREGVLAELKASHPVSDGEPRDYEVMVPAGEASEAQSILAGWEVQYMGFLKGKEG